MSELAAALEPVFIHRYHRVPDQEFLTQVSARLGDCPVDRYMRTVGARFYRTPDLKSGLLLDLADDARKAWEKSRPKPEAPQPAPPPFDREDESSNSLWMSIRLELKKRISATDYDNWLLGTAFKSFTLSRGLLTVSTIDEVTAEWCGEEFATKIFEIIRDLGLPVKEIIYKAVAS